MRSTSLLLLIVLEVWVASNHVEGKALFTEVDNGFCNQRPDGDYSIGCMSPYITCASRRPYEKKCPNDLVLDEASGMCVEKTSISLCGGRPSAIAAIKSLAASPPTLSQPQVVLQPQVVSQKQSVSQVQVVKQQKVVPHSPVVAIASAVARQPIAASQPIIFDSALLTRTDSSLWVAHRDTWCVSMVVRRTMRANVAYSTRGR
uniref:Chitin-binding type-2 domain-containing protein n=1 Tax=Parascaris univalens TaxID=6257 RepID=A0A915C785_PARUN